MSNTSKNVIVNLTTKTGDKQSGGKFTLMGEKLTHENLCEAVKCSPLSIVFYSVPSTSINGELTRGGSMPLIDGLVLDISEPLADKPEKGDVTATK